MTTHDWITTGLTVLIFLLGLAMVPMLRNLVNSRFLEIEERFECVEEKAHATILDAIKNLQKGFHEHNADAHAHANLASFAKLESKMEEVRAEIVELRVAIVRRERKTQKQIRSTR